MRMDTGSAISSRVTLGELCVSLVSLSVTWRQEDRPQKVLVRIQRVTRCHKFGIGHGEGSQVARKNAQAVKADCLAPVLGLQIN